MEGRRATRAPTGTRPVVRPGLGRRLSRTVEGQPNLWKAAEARGGIGSRAALRGGAAPKCRLCQHAPPNSCTTATLNRRHRLHTWSHRIRRPLIPVLGILIRRGGFGQSQGVAGGSPCGEGVMMSSEATSPGTFRTGGDHEKLSQGSPESPGSSGL